MRPSLHFCLTGGWFSSDNVGDHAILCGLLDTLKERYDDPRITVITADPEKVRDRYGLDGFAPKQHPIRLLRNLSSADALIYTGGTPLYDDAAHMTYYATVARWARLRDVPYAIFGISLRTIQGRLATRRLRSIVRGASLLGAREQRSLDRFAELVGSDDPRLVFVPDAAIGMRPSDPARASELMRNAGADPNRPHIAVSMRDFTAGESFQTHHYTRSLDRPQIEAYIDSCVAVIESAVSNHRVGVLLTPMHTNAPDDDRRILSEVVQRLPSTIQPDVTLMTDQLGPRDMKAVLGSMQALVGVRFHSLVLAMSMNVPAMSLSYAHKNTAIMRQMGVQDLALDIAELEPAATVTMFDDLMARRSQVRATLERTNVEMVTRSASALDQLDAVIGS